MDEETREYLTAMEGRLMGHMAAREERLMGHMEAMEGRFMARLNDAQEAIIVRVRSCEMSIFALTELARSNNNSMNLLINIVGDLGKRVIDLEKKP